MKLHIGWGLRSVFAFSEGGGGGGVSISHPHWNINTGHLGGILVKYKTLIYMMMN